MGFLGSEYLLTIYKDENSIILLCSSSFSFFLLEGISNY